MVWTSISRLGIQGLQLVTFIVVARWLSPTEYGTFAIVTLVVVMVTLFSDFGLQAALIHESHLSASRKASAFWLNVSIGLAFAGIVALVAYPVDALLDFPHIGPALAVAGISFAVSFTVVPSALLQRKLLFGRLAGIEFIANLGGSITSVYLASRGVGILSLSYGPVVTALTLTIMLTCATRYVPIARPTLDDVRSLWNFSGSLLGVNIVYYIARNIDILVLTVVSTPQQVGLYSRAYSLVSAPITQAGAVIGRVLFPILARARHDTAVLKDRWLRTTFASFGILLPVSIAFATTSPYLIRILFEPRWYPMAAVVSILSIAAPTRLLCNAVAPVFQATGHTKALLRVTLIQGAALAAGVLAGAAWGSIGVAWGVAIATNVASFVPLSIGLGYMGISMLDLVAELKWILLAGAVQFLLMASVWLSGGFGSNLVTLLGSLGIGLVSYLATARIVDREYFRRLTGSASSSGVK